MATIMLNGRQVQVNDDSPLLKNNPAVSSPAASGATGTGVGTAAQSNPAPVYGSNISGFTPQTEMYTPLEYGQKQIADYGQQWKDLTAKGDKAGAADIAAKSLALGTSLGGTRDKNGVWQFGADPYAWAKDSVLNELAMQKKSVDDEIARMSQAGNLAVVQNNNMLQEQLQGLGENKARTDQNIINFQNRRGGFYSGGTDYQLGNNAKGFAQAEGGLRRDVAARNADIWGRNALLAQQAAEKIGMLTQQAPSKIRELIMGQQENDRAFGLQEGQLTGNYNGQRTLAGQGLDIQKAQQEWDNNFKQGQFDWQKAQQTWENAFQEKNFEQQMREAAASRGLQWASLDQRQKEFIADQAFREKQFEFEQKKYNDSLDSGNSDELNGELEGLYTGLSTNQISPSQAVAEIESKLRMGLITQEDATKMKSFIQKYTEGGGSVNKPQVVEDKILSMTPDQLLKEWETNPTGKKAGRAKYDWRSWITDPNGYRAGLTYEMWKDQFGPRLGG